MDKKVESRKAGKRKAERGGQIRDRQIIKSYIFVIVVRPVQVQFATK